MIKRQIFSVIIVFLLFSIETEASLKIEEVKDKMSELTITITPDVGSRTNPLKLNFRGKLYDEKGVSLIQENIQRKEQRGPLIDFLRNMYNIVKNNEKENYIKLWQAKYRKTIEEDYKINPKTWEIYNNLVKEREDCRLMAEYQYGDYVIVQILVIRDRESIDTKTIPLKEEDGKYWLTNDLSKDWIFLYLSQVEARRYEKDYKRKQICTP